MITKKEISWFVGGVLFFIGCEILCGKFFF